MKHRKYFLRSPIRTAKITRLIAKAVDLLIVGTLGILLYPLGIILGILYMVVCDSLQKGQSIGKKFVGMAVISLEDGTPCSIKQSAIRNMPIIIPLAFAIFPIWGWIFAALIGAPLILMEVYLLFSLDSGYRLGDVMADTSVMANDGKGNVITTKPSTSWFTRTTQNFSAKNVTK